MINPWKVLGVHRKSTDKEVQLAFHALAKEFHPDVNNAEARMFTLYNEAYQILKSKKSCQAFLDKILGAEACGACKGQGCTAKGKGLTSKKYTVCDLCGGAGLIIHKEKKDAAITCGTHGARGKGRNKECGFGLCECGKC